MNKYRFLKNCFLLVSLLVLTVYAQAQFQSTPVSKSDKKIIYQGKLFYVHTVKQGQTLHSICAVYGVTIDELKTANKDVIFDPLSIDQVLKIPVPDAGKNLSESKNRPTEKDFIYHTVQAKETPYFLHKKYNVSLESIYKFNPGTENGLQIGQVVRIPRDDLPIDNEVFIPENTPDKTYYEVKQGDTLYRIAQNHDVRIADIVNENEFLRYGLKVGQVISIPGAEMTYGTSIYGSDSVLLVAESYGLSSFQCDSIQKMRTQHPPVKVAILLPFFLEENRLADSIKAVVDSLTPPQKLIVENAQRGKGAAEFYEGFLLAVDSLKENGVNMSLFVYDTEGDSNKVKNILNELEIVEPDLIVGPLFDNNVKLVSKFSFEYKIPFVPPILSKTSGIEQNAYQYLMTPSASLANQQYAKYLSQYWDKNLVLIYKKDLKSEQYIPAFKQALLNHISLKPGFDSLSFTEVLINDSLKLKINKALSDSLENYAIIFSPYEPDVINVITNLHFASRETAIKIFGLPEWQVFSNIKVDQMHDLETVLYSPYFIDYSKEEIKNFIINCRNKLGFEPYKTSPRGSGLNYTYLGYDVGFRFIQSIYMYGSNSCDCTEQFSPQMLLSQYQFSRNSATGFLENKSINIIEYAKDFKIVSKGVVGE